MLRCCKVLASVFSFFLPRDMRLGRLGCVRNYSYRSSEDSLNTFRFAFAWVSKVTNCLSRESELFYFSLRFSSDCFLEEGILGVKADDVGFIEVLLWWIPGNFLSLRVYFICFAKALFFSFCSSSSIAESFSFKIRSLRF